MPPGIDLFGKRIITYYGIILMLGALAAAILTERLARRKGQNGDIVWDGLFWVLIAGIIGARLWHILTPPPSQGITPLYYLRNPLELINTRAGGLGIPGAIIGGVLALYIFTRRRKLDFGFWLDIAAPGLALAQAIGRWGNYVNQELYGPPTNLPWGIYIEREGGYFHPLFLYESLWNLANMGFLLWMSRRLGNRLKNGDVFLTYLIVYPTGRFFLEFLRPDSAMIGGIKINQAIALIIALASAGALLWRHRKKGKEEIEAA
jgi:phosphatidylglycerol:prolipoprotein diacylglycerol transferase